MRKLILLATLAAFVSGCAMSRSHFESADGDIANKMAVSTIGKQEVEQKTSFQVYPNNSGMDLQDGAVSSQDTTGVIPLMQALVTAFTQAQAQQATQPKPAETSRIEQLQSQIESLRTLVENLRPSGVPK